MISHMQFGNASSLCVFCVFRISANFRCGRIPVSAFCVSPLFRHVFHFIPLVVNFSDKFVPCRTTILSFFLAIFFVQSAHNAPGLSGNVLIHACPGIFKGEPREGVSVSPPPPVGGFWLSGYPNGGACSSFFSAQRTKRLLWPQKSTPKKGVRLKFLKPDIKEILI